MLNANQSNNDLIPGLKIGICAIRRKIEKSSKREPLYLLGLNESKKILQNILDVEKSNKTNNRRL